MTITIGDYKVSITAEHKLYPQGKDHDTKMFLVDLGTALHYAMRYLKEEHEDVPAHLQKVHSADFTRYAHDIYNALKQKGFVGNV